MLAAPVARTEKPIEPRLVTTREVANLCGVSEQVVRRWVREKRLPRAKQIGRKYFWTRSVIEKFLGGAA